MYTVARWRWLVQFGWCVACCDSHTREDRRERERETPRVIEGARGIVCVRPLIFARGFGRGERPASDSFVPSRYTFTTQTNTRR